MNTKALIVTLASTFALACSSTPQNPNFGDDTSGSSGGTSSGSSGDDSGSAGSSSGVGGSSGSQSSSSGVASSSSSSSSSGGHASGSSSGSGSGSSSGGQAMCGDAGAVGPGVLWPTKVGCNQVGTPVTLTATPFSVAPGAEVYKCQVFANPFGGVATDILSMHGTMSKGSHHFFLFNMTSLEAAVEPPQGTLGDCAGKGIEFHPFPFLSQTQDWSSNYPTDSTGAPMGYPLVGQNLLMINVHYLNTGTTAINATVSITITPAKAGVVKTHVGTIFLNQTSMSVPATTPPSNYDAKLTWNGDPSLLPPNYTIFTSWSHMHQWATSFTAVTGGKTIYTESNWDSPNLFFHAPNMAEPTTATGVQTGIPMTNTQSITWDCNYFNTTGATLTFGDSAKTNAMCIYLGQYYPASATAPDDIAVLM